MFTLISIERSIGRTSSVFFLLYSFVMGALCFRPQAPTDPHDPPDPIAPATKSVRKIDPDPLVVKNENENENENEKKKAVPDDYDDWTRLPPQIAMGPAPARSAGGGVSFIFQRMWE